MALSPTFRFNGQNVRAQRVAARRAARMVTNVSAETRAALRMLITRSISEGIPPYDAARAIRPMVGMTTQQAAAALNYRQGLIDLGLDIQRVGTLTDRYVEKKIRERALMIARTECLPGDTPVSGAVVSAVYRRWYQGHVAEIRTSGGREFSATPNHPMLTHRGWVAAGEIAEGDHLICDSRRENARAPRHQHVTDPPSTIREVFDAVAAIGIAHRRRTAEPDFHGDGRQGEVEIARADRELMLGQFAALHQEALQNILSPADLAATPFCVSCGRLLAINEPICSGPGPEARTALDEPVADRRLAQAQAGRDESDGLAALVSSDDLCDGRADRVGSFAAREAGCAYDLRHPRLADADACRNFPRIETGAIELDRVAAVVLSGWSGHVYNLSTPAGYFTIKNGVYTGNTLDALNAGAREAGRQAQAEGLLGPDAKQEWLTTPLESLCPDCEPMDGVKVPLGEKFQTTLGEVDGPPLHPNCMCATAILPE